MGRLAGSGVHNCFDERIEPQTNKNGTNDDQSENDELHGPGL